MTPTHPIGLLGLGAYVPDRVMTNDEWAEHVDTSHEWIVERTGIVERRIAADDQTTVDLAEAAARRALDDAGIGPEDVDEIILATDTPEAYIPDTSAYLQARLETREIPTFDLAGSGCAGFLHALDVGRSRVATGKGRVLVVGVELLTRFMNWRDRNTCVLFGDAAGAAVVGTGEEAVEILAATAGTDGSRAGILGLEAGGSRLPFSKEVALEGLHKDISMDGRAVFREAVRRMSEASRRVLEMTGTTKDDLALVVPHQANLRILKAVGQALDLPSDKLFVNVDRYGNTGSASIPLALWEARDQGRLQRGDLVLLTSFGAGFHWGAMLVRF